MPKKINYVPEKFAELNYILNQQDLPWLLLQEKMLDPLSHTCMKCNMFLSCLEQDSIMVSVYGSSEGSLYQIISFPLFMASSAPIGVTLVASMTFHDEKRDGTQFITTMRDF